MIISTAYEKELCDFTALIKRMDQVLNAEAKRNEAYYRERGGKKLEEDVFKALTHCASGTGFEGTVKLVSGSAFPDIVANNMFGVEVKSTEKNQWQSIGSSILESTRNQDVKRVFMTFGKLGHPVEFLSKPYEDCLSEIVVTHYPRYRIDMKLQEKREETIFEKMQVDYDTLRKMENPVPSVASYYKSQLRSGESLWWAPGTTDSAAPMKARLWTALSHDEKIQAAIEGYALFPEILGSSSTKYNRFALWLATQKGIINTNVRDSFSAGGQVDFLLKNGEIVKMPAAFGRIKTYKDAIRETINLTEMEILEEYWGCPLQENRLVQWCHLVSDAAVGLTSVGYTKSVQVLSTIFKEFADYTNKVYPIESKYLKIAETRG